jgi:CDP-glucose 4,6-dehydratase
VQDSRAIPSAAFWRGQRVLVTGNTGFKGSWLSLWLRRMEADVAGFSLPPPTRPSLFELAGLEKLVPTTYGDIRDLAAVTWAVEHHQPTVVFHLAAQPLVRLSYRQPVETYATNIMGTVHVLEATRSAPCVRSVVAVTSDKCYENREWPWAYRETDPLGGHDPYSSSKACAELVAAAYRRSLLSIGIATARAGNVIGGGDWSEDRLLPDCIQALIAGRCISIRNPHATRPWQHVLEPLCGYLLLAERLVSDTLRFGDAWNFGPADEDARTVSWIASQVAQQWGNGARWNASHADPAAEATSLKVDASRARAMLDWSPRLRITEALEWTVDWYKRLYAGEPALALAGEQLERYCRMLQA